MADLTPRSFDIETTGFSETDVITVAGISSDDWAWLVLSTRGRSADEDQLQEELNEQSTCRARLSVVDSEQSLLQELSAFVDSKLDEDRHYVAAYNAERWRGGFDLPFLRTRCAVHNVDWMLAGLAYVDVYNLVQRFNTGDEETLEAAFDVLIGGEHCDPFDSSEEAVTAFEEEQWLDLLLHNLADVQRTQSLVRLGELFVAQKDFRMKNLDPP